MRTHSFYREVVVERNAEGRQDGKTVGVEAILTLLQVLLSQNLNASHSKLT
jgi:hypothetical protein